MSRNKYYAVLRGRSPGIYDKWFGADGAESQINGFPGGIYRGFRSYEEAAEWLTNPGSNSNADNRIKNGNIIKEARCDQTDHPAKNSGQPHETELKKGKTIIYADGGCLKNPGPGGYGVVLIQGENRKELSGGYKMTTNNRMELTACIKGLEMFGQSASVVVYSDSLYVVNGIRKGWAKRWRANNWYRNNTEKAGNADLWAKLLDLCESREVEFIWVRGHDNIRENERCDRLSYEMAQCNDLPPDYGFDNGIFNSR